MCVCSYAVCCPLHNILLQSHSLMHTHATFYTISLQLQQDAGTKRSTGHNIAPASSSTSNNDTVSAGSKGKAWRSAFTEDLPLNDLNASVSIDGTSCAHSRLQLVPCIIHVVYIPFTFGAVSARLAEQRGTTNNNASDNAGTQRMSSSTADAAASKGNTSRGGIPGGDVKGQQLDTGIILYFVICHAKEVPVVYSCEKFLAHPPTHHRHDHQAAAGGLRLLAGVCRQPGLPLHKQHH